MRVSRSPDDRPSTMLPAERLAPPPGAILVRVAATGPDWIGQLPPVPTGHVVTVSVSHPQLREVPTAALLEAGYRIVGIHPHRAGTAGDGTVDLLVTAALIEAEPVWWQQVIALADRAFDLRHGPVQRVLGPEIALHLRH